MNRAIVFKENISFYFLTPCLQAAYLNFSHYNAMYAFNMFYRPNIILIYKQLLLLLPPLVEGGFIFKRNPD
jgi:hypothetical protein